MIKNTKESDFLHTLARWFTMVGSQIHFDDGTVESFAEVAAHLERIAEKLRLLEAHDHLITAIKKV